VAQDARKPVVGSVCRLAHYPETQFAVKVPMMILGYRRSAVLNAAIRGGAFL
jgi:hypothetical protein